MAASEYLAFSCFLAEYRLVFDLYSLFMSDRNELSNYLEMMYCAMTASLICGACSPGTAMIPDDEGAEHLVRVTDFLPSNLRLSQLKFAAHDSSWARPRSPPGPALEQKRALQVQCQ